MSHRKFVAREKSGNLSYQKIVPPKICRTLTIGKFVAPENCLTGNLSQEQFSEICRTGKLSHRNFVAVQAFGNLLHRKIVAPEFCREPKKGLCQNSRFCIKERMLFFRLPRVQCIVRHPKKTKLKFGLDSALGIDLKCIFTKKIFVSK